MGILKNEYKSFLDDIEKNIKNKEDLEYVKGRFASFLDVVLEQMDYVMDYKKDEIEKLEETQNKLSAQIEQMQQVIDNIEKDIYSEDGFDFEIVCPYCNYEFIIDVDENKTEIECPECQNIIELDWSGDVDGEEDNGCSGSCHGCHGCNDEDDDM
jgi:predicted ribosome quality control (RQC) complex YloA/Tae2 family protein